MDTKLNRPPIVCVLGHVDHGKTTLLDAIRKTSVAAREVGGITQSIGASVVTTPSGKIITFIDTPGHAAFSGMRSRGAKVSDIAILVVASDDGVAPQTKEALQFIRDCGVPYIVALTKSDISSSRPDVVLSQLEKEGVAFEGRGGDTPFLGVSAKTGQGIDKLLELISLLSEVGGVKGDKNGRLEAIVVETNKGKMGPTVSAVVRNGTLKVGEEVFAEGNSTKIRGLFNHLSQSVKEILPGYPGQILGFSILPQVGTVIRDAVGILPAQSARKSAISALSKDQIPVFIKAGNAGSLEAILAGVPGNIIVLEAGVGDVSESDILNARANGVARIYLFETKAGSSVVKLAESEGVKIESFNIIYKLFTAMEDLLKKGQVEILGKAEIIASFPFNSKKVAGCKLIFGRMVKSDSLKLTRGEAEIGKIRATSLRRGKLEVNEVKTVGEEFGLIFEPQLDFAIGDVIVSMR